MRDLRRTVHNHSLADRVLAAIGFAFLAVGVVLVIHGLLTPGNHFAWGPHTTQIRFELRVKVDGESLSPRDSARRYGLRWSDAWEAHAIENVFQLIEQYERTYGAGESAEITLRFRRNRGEWQLWHFPN